MLQTDGLASRDHVFEGVFVPESLFFQDNPHFRIQTLMSQATQPLEDMVDGSVPVGPEPRVVEIPERPGRRRRQIARKAVHGYDADHYRCTQAIDQNGGSQRQKYTLGQVLFRFVYFLRQTGYGKGRYKRPSQRGRRRLSAPGPTGCQGRRSGRCRVPAISRRSSTRRRPAAWP